MTNNSDRLGQDRYMFYILLLCAVVILICRIFLVFSYSPDLAGVEEFQIILLKLASKCGNPYTSLSGPPCLAVPYGPVYYKIMTVFFKYLNLSLNRVHAIYILCRFSNLLINLVTVFICYLILQQFTLSRALAFAFALAFFCFFFFDHYAVRPDSLKLFFASLHLLFMVKLHKGRNIAVHILLASFFLSCAVLTKQDALQMFVPACLSFILLYKCRKAMILLAAFSAGFVITSFLLLFHLQFDLNTARVALNSIYWGINTGSSIKYFYLTILIGFLVPALPVIILSQRYAVQILRNQLSGRTIRLLAIYLISSFILSFLFSLRLGAMPVYYAEFVLIAVIITGVKYAERPNNKLRFIIPFYAVMMCAINVLFTINKTTPDLKMKFLATEKSAGLILSETPGGLLFAYDPLMDIFIADRLCAPNMGWEFFNHWFYEAGFNIKSINYSIYFNCNWPEWIISTDRQEMEAYFRKMDSPYQFYRAGTGYCLFRRK